MLGHRALEVADYVTILKRRRWLILAAALLCPIIGVIITRFIPPKYTSQTLVLIEQQKVPDDIVKPVVDSNLDSRLSSMKEQILSRSRIQPIIEHYDLYAKEHMTMDDRVEAARKAIEIKPIHSAIATSGGLPGFFVTFSASDAHTAQLVCGEITTLFMNENLRNQESTSESTTDFLKGQLEDAKRNLTEQDQKLRNFQEKNFGQLPSQEGTNMGMMNSLNSQLDAATQALAQMQQQLTYEQSILASLPAMEARPSRQAQAQAAAGLPADGQGSMLQQRELAALEDRETQLTTLYTPSHPDVIAVRRQIAQLKREIAVQSTPEAATPATAAGTVASTPVDSPGALQLKAQIRATEAGIAEKRREQSAIQGRLGSYESRVQSTPQVEEEYKDVTRDYNTAQQFYNELQVKMEHAKEASDLGKRQEGEQFRVMDEANLPDSPSFPKVGVFAGIGLALGLIIGLVIAAWLEYKDTALRNERDVWAFTRLPTLGVISVAGEIPDEEESRPRKRRRLWDATFGRFRRKAGSKPDAKPDIKPDSGKLADARG